MFSESIEKLLNITLEDSLRARINNSARRQRLLAGDTVMREGDRYSCLYLLQKGIVRGYYIDSQGNDMTKCFSCEGDVFCSEGLRSSGPATFTIECLEDCECVSMPCGLVHEIMEADPRVACAIRRLFEQEVGRLEKRSRDLMMKNAEERYLLFCEEYPELHHRVALKHIASYIGVRTASLSRIRRQLKNHAKLT